MLSRARTAGSVVVTAVFSLGDEPTYCGPDWKKSSVPTLLPVSAAGSAMVPPVFALEDAPAYCGSAWSSPESARDAPGHSWMNQPPLRASLLLWPAAGPAVVPNIRR